jgi:hypothetical protein
VKYKGRRNNTATEERNKERLENRKGKEVQTKK